MTITTLSMLLVLAQPASLGQGAPPAAEARYQVARQLYLQGDYAGAAREFAVAFEMMPESAKLAYNLARSEERAGHMSAAVRAFRDYLRLAPGAKDRDEVAAIVTALDRRLEAEKPEVVITSAPSGASVRIDEGSAVGKTPVTLKLPPGAHSVSLELPGYHPETRAIEVRAGTPATVHAELSEPFPVMDAVGWSAIGLGAAGIGLAIFYDQRARATVEESSRAEAQGDRERYDDLQQNLDVQNGWIVAGSVVGSALILTGAGLLFWPTDDGAGANASLFVAPNGVVGQVRW